MIRTAASMLCVSLLVGSVYATGDRWSLQRTVALADIQGTWQFAGLSVRVGHPQYGPLEEDKYYVKLDESFAVYEMIDGDDENIHLSNWSLQRYQQIKHPAANGARYVRPEMGSPIFTVVDSRNV